MFVRDFGRKGEGVGGVGLGMIISSKEGKTPLPCFALEELPSWGAWRECSTTMIGQKNANNSPAFSYSFKLNNKL